MIHGDATVPTLRRFDSSSSAKRNKLLARRWEFEARDAIGGDGDDVEAYEDVARLDLLNKKSRTLAQEAS